jgi:hypothetical protein
MFPVWSWSGVCFGWANNRWLMGWRAVCLLFWSIVDKGLHVSVLIDTHSSDWHIDFKDK